MVSRGIRGNYYDVYSVLGGLVGYPSAVWRSIVHVLMITVQEIISILTSISSELDNHMQWKPTEPVAVCELLLKIGAHNLIKGHVYILILSIISAHLSSARSSFSQTPPNPPVAKDSRAKCDK